MALHPSRALRCAIVDADWARVFADAQTLVGDTHVIYASLGRQTLDAALVPAMTAIAWEALEPVRDPTTGACFGVLSAQRELLGVWLVRRSCLYLDKRALAAELAETTLRRVDADLLRLYRREWSALKVV